MRRTSRVPNMSNQRQYVSGFAPIQTSAPLKRKHSEVAPETTKTTKRRKHGAPKTQKKRGGRKKKEVVLPKILQQYTIGSKIDAHYQGKWYECDVLKIDAKKGLFIHWVGFPKSQNQWFDLEDVHFCKPRVPMKPVAGGIKKPKKPSLTEVAPENPPTLEPVKSEPILSDEQYFQAGMLNVVSPTPSVPSKPTPPRIACTPNIPTSKPHRKNITKTINSQTILPKPRVIPSPVNHQPILPKPKVNPSPAPPRDIMANPPPALPREISNSVPSSIAPPRTHFPPPPAPPRAAASAFPPPPAPPRKRPKNNSIPLANISPMLSPHTKPPVKKVRGAGYVGVTIDDSQSMTRYKGHVWNPRTQKSVYVGIFTDKLEAAKAVNSKCIELGIPVKNPGVEPKDSPAAEMKNTLNPIGVTWDKETKRWRAYLWNAKAKVREELGLFEDQIDAAKAVNARCRIYGIAIKNPQFESVESSTANKKIVPKVRASKPVRDLPPLPVSVAGFRQQAIMRKEEIIPHEPTAFSPQLDFFVRSDPPAEINQNEEQGWECRL